MTERGYLTLPINADEGFPQAFRLAFNDRIYRVTLYVNVPEEEPEEDPERIYELPAAGAFMVMRVEREGDGPPAVILQRKLVREHEYEAQELAFRFTRMRVAKRNLNGVGVFGSVIEGGIAAR